MSEAGVEIYLENGQFKVKAKESADILASIGTKGKSAGENAAGGLKKVEQQLSVIDKVAKASVVMFVAQKIYEIGKAALKGASDLEKNRMAFETMLGSQQKAARLMNAIQVMAAKTPFETPGLVEAAKKLIAFGIAEDEVIAKMTSLGDASMGNQEVFERLADAYGKTAAKGKASMEEMNRFLEAGVPILDTLAEQYNTTGGNIVKMVEAGKIGIKDIDKAITTLTTGNGKFAGLMEKQAESLGGKFSTLADGVMMSLTAMGEEMAPAFKDLIDIFTEAADSGGLFGEVLKGIGTIAGAIVSTFVIIVSSLQEMIYGIQEAKAYINDDAEALAEAREKGAGARARSERAAARLAGMSDGGTADYYEDESGRKITDDMTNLKYDDSGLNLLSYDLKQGDGSIAHYENGKLMGVSGGGKRAGGGAAGGGGAGKFTMENFQKDFGKAGKSDVEIAQYELSERLKLLQQYKAALNLNDTQVAQIRMKVEEETESKILQMRTKKASEWLNFAAGFASKVADTIGAAFKQQDESATAALERAKETGTAILEFSREQALMAAGAREETEVQKADAEIKTLEKKLAATAGAEKRATIQKELEDKRRKKTELEINQEYAQKQFLFDTVMELRRRNMAREQFERNKALQMVNTVISTSAAAMSAFSSSLQMGLPWPVALGLSLATAAMGAVNVGLIASQNPPLAAGGIIPGTPTGMTYTVGERGRSEAVLPLESPEAMNRIRDALGIGEQTVHTHIHLDGRQIAETVDKHRFDRASRMGAADYAYRGAY